MFDTRWKRFEYVPYSRRKTSPVDTETLQERIEQLEAENEALRTALKAVGAIVQEFTRAS